MSKKTTKTEAKAAKPQAKKAKVVFIGSPGGEEKVRAAAAKAGLEVTTPAEQRKAADQAKAAPAKAPKKREGLSGLDAAAKVLGAAKGPLNAKELVEQMLSQGLWKTNGETPHATIYAAIIREIAQKGKEARFRKVERGRFALKTA